MKTKNFCLTLVFTMSIFKITGQTSGDVDNIFNSITGPNNEPIVYNTINMSSFDLASSNLQFSEKNNSQKLVILPLKLLNDDPGDYLRNIKLNIAQKDGKSTFGIGFGFDNSSPFSRRGDRIFEEIDLPAKRTQKKDESDFEYQKYEAAYELRLDKAVANYYEDLLKNSFQITLSFNTSFFSIIGGDKVDLDDNNLIDNQYSVESYNYSLGASYSFNSATALSAAVHLVNKRGSAEEGEKSVLYAGGSFTFAHRIIILDSNYKTSKDYFKSLFVSSIVMGITVEYQEATNNIEFAKDGIIKQYVYTPFFDFKINPNNQFRLGIPIQKQTKNTNEVTLSPFIQWGFSILNKSK